VLQESWLLREGGDPAHGCTNVSCCDVRGVDGGFAGAGQIRKIVIILTS
jgi:hypothetical protein